MRLWAHLLHVRVLQQSAALPQHRQRVQRQVRLEAAEALPALGLVDRDDLGENKALPRYTPPDEDGLNTGGVATRTFTWFQTSRYSLTDTGF